jgi:hypothetical protein
MPGINKTKYEEIGRKVRELPIEKYSSSYEWDELVERLCASDDIRLHDIGSRELDELRQKNPNKAA